MNFTNKRLYIGIGILIFLFLYFFLNPSDFDFFPKCPFHEITGYYCPGCGSQRAIHDVLRGNFLQAISHNVLLIITVFGGILFYLINKSKFLTVIYHPKTPLIAFAIIVLYWILRNINAYPFTFLAP